MKRAASILFLLFVLGRGLISAQGNVYLIIGSDTAIWDAMDVAKYNCNYNYNIIPDRTQNFYEVMQSSYRSKFSDSYGNTLKLTWWLMCGNIFRYANNKNVPYANIMVPYISKTYFGNAFAQFGDELSLHYHTFAWTDYDGDGKYWWNQAKTFGESKDDFDYTLAQLLLEENIFPVSFRSGWNHMSNEWQAELDKLLPYSMHNEAAGYHLDNQEPLDNNYDWRLASKEFVPYRPSPQNYQLNGNGTGWNLHSRYVGGVTLTEMKDIFSKARTKDQVVCLWGHVWDELFPEYVLKIDSLAKAAAGSYPNVKFKYCTAVEGMQLWRKNTDLTPPAATMQELATGNFVKYIVQTDEPIFQAQPFLALKDITESYQIVQFNRTGANEWTSINSYEKKNVVKTALAVTDTLGNLKKQIINNFQDDIYVDNGDLEYSELNGSWTTESKASWGLDSRRSVLKANDSSKVKWGFKINSPHYYNIFLQLPRIEQACKNVKIRIYGNGQLLDTIIFSDSIPGMEWVYLTTQYLNPSSSNYVEMVAYGTGQESNILSADVIKITPLVREKWLSASSKLIDMGQVIKKDTAKTFLNLSNNGMEPLTISGITSKYNYASVRLNFPVSIPRFGKITIPLFFYSTELGKKADTLFIASDDPFNTVVSIALNAEVTNYFKIVDNEETSYYTEHGIWSKSVAQAFGSTSRFANLNQSPRASAVFTLSVAENAFYDVSFIVPVTVNASNKALYVIEQGNKLPDSVYVDQNFGSGRWFSVKKCYLTGNLPVRVKIVDNGKATEGAVLRADAVKLSYVSSASHSAEISIMPTEFRLQQNYPNPFNPNTSITYHLPQNSLVKLKIYNLLGEEVATLVNKEQPAGVYRVDWNAADKASGIYFYRIEACGSTQMKKMILLK